MFSADVVGAGQERKNMSDINKATSELAIQPGQTGFTQKQVAALRQLGVEKVNESDLEVFFHQCVRTGLDPFARQVYLVGRWDGRAQAQKYTIQTGIDGYRLIAERTGVYAGNDESWVEGPNGLPTSSTVTVYKMIGGNRCPFTATAHWSEYCQTTKDARPMGLWAKMPHRMLAKCAEALALRKAFPQDLSGVYTSEEMSQADSEPRVSAPVAIESRVIDVEVITADVEAAAPVRLTDEALIDDIEPKQLKRIQILKKDAALTDEQYRAGLEKVAGVDSAKKLSKSQAADVIIALERAVGKRQTLTNRESYWNADQVEEVAS